MEIREFISKRWKNASIAEVGLERSANTVRLVIKTSKPGVLIGRGGSGIEDITKSVKEKFFANRNNFV